MSAEPLERLEAEVAETRTAGEPRALAAGLRRLGTAHLRAGRGEAAVACLGEAAALVDVEGQERQRAGVLRLLALAHAWQGEEEAACRSARSAAALYRGCGERRDEAFAMRVLAGVLADFRRTGEALAAWNEALDASRAIDDTAGEAEALAGRARLRLRKRGTEREALPDLERALALQEGLGDRAGQAECLRLLGVAHLRLGDLEAAETRLTRALALAREAGADEVAPTLAALSAVYARRRDLARAVAFAEEGLAVHRAEGDREGEAACLATLAGQRRRQGRFIEALRLFAAAVRAGAPGISPRRVRELHRRPVRITLRTLRGLE